MPLPPEHLKALVDYFKLLQEIADEVGLVDDNGDIIYPGKGGIEGK